MPELQSEQNTAEALIKDAKPKIPIPENEAERLDALRGLAILDTFPEDEYDRITRLARIVFKARMAAVSFVDEDRQWFKSAAGVNLESTPRDHSFCTHAILGDKPLIVLDATKDERFADNPLVTGDFNVRFYAGVPLVSHSGARVGALCIIDTEARTSWSAVESGLLRDLAGMVSNELKARQTRIEHHRVMQELRALRSQASLDGMVDALTGVPDRRALGTIIAHVKSAADTADRLVALLCVDMQAISQVNEKFGEAAGNQVLRTMTQRFRSLFRTNDFILRIAGDQFLIVLQGLELMSNVELPARKLLSSNVEPIPIEGGTELLVPISVGAIFYPHCGSTPLELVNNARNAVRAARNAGGNCCAVSVPGKPVLFIQQPV